LRSFWTKNEQICEKELSIVCLPTEAGRLGAFGNLSLAQLSLSIKQLGFPSLFVFFFLQPG
jgi:hypothetical protein